MKVPTSAPCERLTKALTPAGRLSPIASCMGVYLALVSACSAELEPRGLRTPSAASDMPEPTLSAATEEWRVSTAAHLLLVARLGYPNVSVVDLSRSPLVAKALSGSEVRDLAAYGSALAILRSDNGMDILQTYCAPPRSMPGMPRAVGAFTVASSARLLPSRKEGYFWVVSEVGPESGEKLRLDLYQVECAESAKAAELQPTFETTASFSELASIGAAVVATQANAYQIFLPAFEPAPATDPQAEFRTTLSGVLPLTDIVNLQPIDDGVIMVDSSRQVRELSGSRGTRELLTLPLELEAKTVRFAALHDDDGAQGLNSLVLFTPLQRKLGIQPLGAGDLSTVELPRPVRDVFAGHVSAPIVVSYERSGASNLRGYTVISANDGKARHVDTRLRVDKVAFAPGRQEVWVSLIDPAGGAGELRVETATETVSTDAQPESLVALGRVELDVATERIYALRAAADGELLSFSSFGAPAEVLSGFDVRSRCTWSAPGEDTPGACPEVP